MAKISCSHQLETETFRTEREWSVEGIPALTATASVPVPVHTDSRTARRIRRYYQTQCRAFLRYCQHILLPQAAAEYKIAVANSAPLPNFHAELSYRITWNRDGLWSLYTQSRENTGETLLLCRGDTWDLSTGYPVELSAFFSRGWRKRLRQLIAEEIQRRERAGAAHFLPDWPRRLRRTFNPQNFYLTEEGLMLFFPMYAITPASEWIPTFLIPYSQLNCPYSLSPSNLL